MKRSVMLAVGAAVVLSCPAFAQDHDFLVVKAPPTVEQWAANISRSLESSMDYPVTVGRAVPFGAVRVSFACNENGVPKDVTLVEGSRFRSIDAAALRAIRKLKTLHPLPAAIASSQFYQADLFFARDEHELHRMQKAWRASRHLAAKSANTVRFAVLAIN